jgi:transposase
MSQKRKWSASQKFEIALMAIKNETTINDICKKYEVAPCQVHEWKKKLLEQGENIFVKNDKEKQTAIDDAEKKQEKLFEKIGELTVERDFLKKSLKKLPFNFDKD